MSDTIEHHISAPVAMTSGSVANALQNLSIRITEVEREVIRLGDVVDQIIDSLNGGISTRKVKR